MGALRQTVPLAVAVLLAVPATAAAGTARVDVTTGTGDGEQFIADSVVYDAAPGERNDITARVSAQAVTIQDTGAPVTAGRGCDQSGSHEAICHTQYEPPGGTINAGDGDDTVRLVSDPGAPGGLTANGGPGNDTL